MASDAARLEQIRSTIADSGNRVLLRAVRRPVRAAEREARPRRAASTRSSRTAPASPASRPARSARSRATRTSPPSPTSDSFTPVPWQPNLARFACDVTVEGEPWPYCPRTILRNVLARAARAGLRVQDRARARVLPRPAQRRRLDRDRRPARHAGEALLRHGRADAPVRLPDHGVEVLQRARLGELRERPRGRERPVRAELRRTTTRSSPATAPSSSATWCTRSPSSMGRSRRSCRSRSRT